MRGVSNVRFGHPRHHLATVDSTNRLARELAEHAPPGTIVTAAAQTAGRGRHGRRWVTPSGRAVAYSAVLKPFDSPSPLLSIAVGVAVCEATEKLGGRGVELKWPNDVWVAGRKLAGILIESRAPDWAVIGIGLNLDVDKGDLPDDGGHGAASLGRDTRFEDAVEQLNLALTRWVYAPDVEVLAAFRRYDLLYGSRIVWSVPGVDDGIPEGNTGEAKGIDDKGRLIVEKADGETVTLDSGEVSLRPY